MRVLVACEFSGIVRDALISRGHDAMSCDLLDTERPGPHYKGDVRDVLYSGWDMMIGHPPCTYLSYAGTQVWDKPGRIQLRLDALAFFALLWNAPIERICLENPKGCASPVIAKYTQEIQPYFFGESQQKTTWLWLKNLPPLVHSNTETLFEGRTSVDKPMPICTDSTGKKRYFTDAKIRDAGERARTFPGIAAAMAEQWGGLN